MLAAVLGASLLVGCANEEEPRTDDDRTEAAGDVDQSEVADGADRTETTDDIDGADPTGAAGGPDPADHVEPTDAGEVSEGEDQADGEMAAPPVSVVTVEPIDAPQSSSEIRVGEIILEFDGEVTGQGTVLTLEEPILFDFDSATLRPGSRQALDDVAEVVAFYEDAPVQVVGHTDNQGNRDYNLGLSQQRADAVVDGLARRGIGADRLSAEGRAFDEPIASNDTDEGRAENRRVEVLIVGVVPPGNGG